jgi:flagellar FliJ protein
MSRWIGSLIRLADLEVETLQKRLRDIADRRVAVQMVLDALAMEEREEHAYADRDATAGWYLTGFREGLKQRRARARADLAALDLEERGARDALAEAFESQKKYETLAENARLAAVRETARRETLVLDEVALRMTGTR